jgi:Na+/proline symporter
MRDGIIGAVIGFIVGLIVIAVISYNDYFPPEVPDISYFFIVVLLTMFCSWEGGLAGSANENKKLSEFHDDLEAGKYLILVYVRANQEEAIIRMMETKHPDIHLEGSDSSFFNPLSRVQRI